MTWRDPYLWPDADVLQNKAGIKSEEELAFYESNYTQFRGSELLKNPIPGNFDLQHLCDIHHYLFQDVYEFAGQLRTVSISKGEKFAPTSAIPRLFELLSTQLKKENFLANLSPNQFAERAALYFNAVNIIHPFREGNGRTQRCFIEQLAKEAGHTLNLEAVSSKLEMDDASIQGRGSNIESTVTFNAHRPTLLINMFQKAINPAYVDIMQQAKTALIKRSQIPEIIELIPAIDVEPNLSVQGTILAKNDLYTAQLNGITTQLNDTKWFVIHQNKCLSESLQPGEIARVDYDEKGIGTAETIGKASELPHPIPLLPIDIKNAKALTRLNTVYHGKFVHVDDKHFYQELGHGNIIKHPKSAFPPTQTPELGKFNTIKYENGQAQLISKTLNKNLEKER